MKSVTKTLTGFTTLLAAGSVFAHPGHTSQWIHSHEGMTLGAIGMVVVGLAVAAGMVLSGVSKKSAARQKQDS